MGARAVTPRRYRLRILRLVIGSAEGSPSPGPPSLPQQTGLVLLCKIGKAARMKALVEHGTVFMRRLSKFREIKHAEVGDPDEGSATRFTEDNPTLRFFATIGEKKIRLRARALRTHSPEQHHAVYCMYGLLLPEDGVLRGDALMRIARDKRLRSMGDTFVTFKDQREFGRRLLEAAKKAGYALALRQVQYVPPAHCGEWEWYHKTDAYSHQAEWRIITTHPIPGDSLTLTWAAWRTLP